ncbi:MAG TPA: GAF domain-containing protein [Baekduia sp.]
MLLAVVSGVVALLEPRVPALGLGVLYLLAVVPIAFAFGAAAAAAVSLASMVVFSFFFLDPRYTLDPGSAQRWEVLVAFLVSSLVVSELAARSRRAVQRSTRLADEHAALRRVATLVARGDDPPEVFAAVAREVAMLLGVDATHMVRFEPGGAAAIAGSWSLHGEHWPVGRRVDLDGDTVIATVARTGRPARVHDYRNATGDAARVGRELGLRSSVGAPIVVDQHLWGVMVVSTSVGHSAHPLPLDAESRIGAFTELVATAISNVEARRGLARLADEQAALRRLATLIARGVASAEVFDAAADEIGRLLGVEFAVIGRFDADNMVTVLSSWGPLAAGFAVGSRWPIGGDNLARLVLETGSPARIDGYEDASGELARATEQSGVGSSVGVPISFEGRVWAGISVASSGADPLPADTESRLTRFAELVATAMSNAQARAEVQRLADEQSSLRRVATLIARESRAEDVFAAVAEEVLRVLDDVEIARMYRYEPDGTATLVADAGSLDARIGVGTRVRVEGRNVSALVRETGRAARLDDHEDATGSLGVRARELGVRSAVGAPIVVGDRLWGVIIVGSKRPAPLPPTIETRITEFTELVATSISNVQARTEVAASRARVVAAADEERRRVVRDLHDGAQQRLVHTIVTLKLARRTLAPPDKPAAELVAEALEHATRAHVELRDLAHGILPSVLTQGGLRAGVDALASRAPVPVDVDVPVGRLPTAVEATAYFVVSEALTNVAKHARAGHVEVSARLDDGTLAVRVRDDGIGGARPGGSGLTGLADRLAALDGELRVESPAAGGTILMAAIPVAHAA